jgi:hypothetical protein
VVGHLPSKHEALNSNPGTNKKKKKERKKEKKKYSKKQTTTNLDHFIQLILHRV